MIGILGLLSHCAGVELLARIRIVFRVDVLAWCSVLLGRGV